MTVDRNTTPHRSAYDGATMYFCSAHCNLHDADRERLLEPREAALLAHAGHDRHH